VHEVPQRIDDEVARLALEAGGVRLEGATKEEVNYAKSWGEGT